MQRFVALMVAMLWGMTAQGAEPSVMLKPASEPRFLTGNARLDFIASPVNSGQQGTMQEPLAGEQPYRSPWIAAGLSIVVPGAGEFYAESYWKAAAFLAVEVAVWSIAYSFDKRGDRQTDHYQDFANRHWSVVQYGQYAYDNFLTEEQQGRLANWRIPGTEGRPPWEQVNWSVLNQMEREIARTAAGQYFSHTLPLYGEQQYFELIGKYQQYYHGWSDADMGLMGYDAITAFLRSNPDVQFSFYSRERGKANDYYAIASTAVTIGILNHILSAVDAAWSAGSFNKRFQARVGLQSVPAGDYVARVPVAKFSYTF